MAGAPPPLTTTNRRTKGVAMTAKLAAANLVNVAAFIARQNAAVTAAEAITATGLKPSKAAAEAFNAKRTSYVEFDIEVTPAMPKTKKHAARPAVIETVTLDRSQVRCVASSEFAQPKSKRGLAHGVALFTVDTKKLSPKQVKLLSIGRILTAPTKDGANLIIDCR